MKRWLGIDLGGSSIKWCTTDESPESQPVVRTRPTPSGPKAVREALEEVISESAREHSNDELCGICIGTPGLVDDTGAILGDAVNLPGWGNQSLESALAAGHDLPITVKNDASLATLAETRVGAAVGHKHVMGIFLGTGIGGGVCVNGSLYEGAGGLAGEIGHCVVVPHGAPCPCGQEGCLERYSSASGVVRICLEHANRFDSPLAQRARAFEASRSGAGALTAHEIYAALEEGDPLARVVHEEASERLAQAVGIVINVLTPELVVLGGGVMRSGPVIIDAVRAYLPRFTLPDSRKRSQLTRAALGVQAGAIGAAWHARELGSLPTQ